jgi:hypothetical protein
MIDDLFPFASLNRIILFNVYSWFSLESLHVVRFCYFQFEDVFINDAFVGFLVWEGVRDEFDDEDAPIFVAETNWHLCFDIMC